MSGMSREAREIAAAIGAAYRPRTGAGSLPEALAAARETEDGRWAIADNGERQLAALMRPGGIRVWWRREFSAPQWQPYTEVVLPRLLWLPADPDNLPRWFTLPIVAPASSPG